VPSTIHCIKNAVFFTLPEDLPKGRHSLARDQILLAQKERMLIGMTELLAAEGYKGFNAGDIAKRAGVSLRAFYECFDDKEACVFAGYDRFIQALLNRMMAVKLDGVERTELVRNIVSAYLDTMQSDLVVARAYQVEIDALGEVARARRRQSLTLFAMFIQQAVVKSAQGGLVPPSLTRSAYIGVVYAVRQLVSDAIESELNPNLKALNDDLAPWLNDIFRIS
jgi:AcrR family transcriptional regulator